jgi:hypothetical protein
MIFIALVVALAAPPAAPPASSDAAPTGAQCDARRAAKVGLAVDANAPSALTASVVARLTAHCVSPVAVSGSPPDDAAAAKAKGLRFLIRVSGKSRKLATGKVDGVEMTTYGVNLMSRVLRVADAVVVADISEDAQLMGRAEDMALGAANRVGEGRNKYPVAWRTADRVVAALDAELGLLPSATSGPPSAVGTASCAQPIGAEIAAMDAHDGAGPLRNAVIQRFAAGCVTPVEWKAKTPGAPPTRIEMSIVPRIAASSKLATKDSKMQPYEWVLTLTLSKSGKEVAKETAVSRVTLGVDAANAAKNLAKDKGKLEPMLVVVDSVAAAAR